MQHNSRIALLATGNELVEGDILNTNGQAIAQALGQHGFEIGLHVIAADDDADLEAALAFLLPLHIAVIITGGLGPTSDDRTRQALSKVTGAELQFDEAVWQYICERSQTRYGRQPHPANRQQALFPQGATVLPNPEGSAAGCKMPYKNNLIYMLPGPPHECLLMFENFVLPDLITNIPHENRIKMSWQLQGAFEGEIAALIDEALKDYPVITGYRASKPYLEVKIYSYKHDKFDEMIITIKKIIDPYLVA